MRRRCRNDAGQATVEFAVVLPLVAILVLGVVQIAVVAREHLAVWHAARTGARAAAVSHDPVGAGTRAALAATGLDAVRFDVTVVPTWGATGPWVDVVVDYLVRTEVPIIGRLLPDFVVSASVSMAREPPDDR
jgi:Flp pilus assembly protein TadG